MAGHAAIHMPSCRNGAVVGHAVQFVAELPLQLVHEVSQASVVCWPPLAITVKKPAGLVLTHLAPCLMGDPEAHVMQSVAEPPEHALQLGLHAWQCELLSAYVLSGQVLMH